MENEAKKVMKNYGLIGKLYSNNPENGKKMVGKQASLDVNNTIDVGRDYNAKNPLSSTKGSFRIANTTYLTQATTTLSKNNKTKTGYNGDSGNNSSQERNTTLIPQSSMVQQSNYQPGISPHTVH